MATSSDLSHAPISPGVAAGDSRGNGGVLVSGDLVAASCIPDRDKPDGRFFSQTAAFIDHYKAEVISKPGGSVIRGGNLFPNPNPIPIGLSLALSEFAPASASLLTLASYFSACFTNR